MASKSSAQEKRAHFKRHPSEIHLRELANDIGSENERLGTQLGFKKPDLDKFKANYRNFEDRIFYMLVNWKQKNYAIPDLFAELVNALTKVDRRDLASKVEDWKGKPNRYASRDIVDEDDEVTEAPGNQAIPRPILLRSISKIDEKEFLIIASKIGEEWQKFATFLGLKGTEIYRIKIDCQSEEDRVFNVMVKWQQTMTPNTNMVKTLAKALEDSGRVDLKEEILDKYGYNTTKEPIIEPTEEEINKNLLEEYNLPSFLGKIAAAYKEIDTPSIPFDLYVKLCMALDPEDPRGNDWRMLAGHLKLSRYINYLKTHYKDGPTSCVLLCWMKQKESMDKLADFLVEIDRGDAASLIRNHGKEEEDEEQEDATEE